MLLSTLLLLTLGVAVIYSSSQILAVQQLFYAILGIIIYFGLRQFDYRSLKTSLIFGYVLIIVLLVATLILGVETRGSVRWIPLGPFNLQPSELSKPLLILILARFWSSNRASWKNILKSVGLILPVCILIFRQPDLGTTLTVIFIWFSLLFASQIEIIKIFVIGLFSLTLIPSIWVFLADYQKRRIVSFLNPAQDPQGIGFHVIQSTIAVGSGQLWGRGLGRGTQSRLQFLPEFRTDFIFAFIAEELGFIGSVIVLLLYAILFFSLFRLLSMADDRFGELIVIGVISMLFLQLIINIGMNIGLLPITGITLPLLSYGGSSVLTTLVSLGLCASVANYGLKRRTIDRRIDTTILPE